MAASQSCGLVSLPLDATVQQHAQAVVDEGAQAVPTRLTFSTGRLAAASCGRCSRCDGRPAVTIPYRWPASIDGARDAADRPTDDLMIGTPGCLKEGGSFRSRPTIFMAAQHARTSKGASMTCALA